MDNGRYSRQIALFGAEGQQKLAASRVAVIGLGGLGSQVCQQLAYLGVRSFNLVDDDTVTRSNLNRLIGAGEGDVGAPKVAIAQRLIKSVLPDSGVRVHQQRYPDPDVRSAIAESSVVFGCVDEEPVRVQLLEVTSELGIPYIDAATDVVPPANGRGDRLVFGGRVCFCFVSGGCLSCLDQLDQEGLRTATMTEEQRRDRAAIYGVERSALAETGPAVVSLNGVVASLAVTEFMVWVTGLLVPQRVLTYRANVGTVARNLDEPRSGCYYCSRYARVGENGRGGS
jgi:hypothetical protein